MASVKYWRPLACVRQAMTAVATEVSSASSSNTYARGGQRELHLLGRLRIAASRMLSAAGIIVSEGGRWLQEPRKVNFGWRMANLLLKFSVFFLVYKPGPTVKHCLLGIIADINAGKSI